MSILPEELISLEINLLPNAELYIVQSEEQGNVTIETTINAATLKDTQEISPVLYQQDNGTWTYSIQRPNYLTIWLCSHSTTILRLPKDMSHIGKLLITQGYSMNIEINLPDTKVDVLTIESSFSDISISSLNTTRFINVRKSGTLKGNIELNEPKNTTSQLESSAKKCKLYMESKDGKTQLLQIKLPEQNNSCEISAKSVNGDIDFMIDNFSGNFQMGTQSGKISISGNAEFDVDEDTRKEGRLNGKGDNKIRIETISGSIVLIAN